MKIYLTGTSGFLGSHLLARLQTLGHQVIRGDRSGLLPEPVDLVIDCASYGNLHGQDDREEMVRANVQRVARMLDQKRKYKKFILTSSSSVSMRHTTQYALTKANAEDLAIEYGATIIRPYTIYGIGDNPVHLIPRVFRSCLQGEPMELDPNPTHDYIYIDDLVDLYIDPPSRLVEAGLGLPVKNQTVVNLIEFITGKRANITKRVSGLRDYDQPNWCAPRPAKKHMTILSDGLIKIYEYTKQSSEKTYH